MGLKCGVPEAVPALTVNRLCGSGFQAVINGAQVRAVIVSLICIHVSMYFESLLLGRLVLHERCHAHIFLYFRF